MIIERKLKKKELVLAIGVGLFAVSAQAEFPTQFELSTLNGTNGVVFNGIAAGDLAGTSVSAAGDINGDGIDDIVIGAPDRSNIASGAGASYVVFGKGQGLPSPLNLSALSASTGLAITGANFLDSVGYSVNEAGDVNGDGFDDLIVGAPTYVIEQQYVGAAFVIFGTDQTLPASLSISSLNGGNGFAVLGNGNESSSGASVSGAGDINGDGFDDLIIGAPFTTNGTAYVVFGKAGGWAPSVAVAELNGSNGFRIDAAGDFDTLGKSVSSAGDINGDGIDDIIVGATLAGTENAYSGAAYVVFGTNLGFTHPLNVANLIGSNGFVLRGVSQSDFAGFSVSSAGDLNGDNIDDLVVGAPKASPNGTASGASYVVFGSNQAWASSLNLSSLNGSNGFAVYGATAGDELGTSVSAAGDINDDGFDDLIIGAPLADPNGIASGASYVILGKNTAWTATVNVGNLDGTNGFRVKGVSAGDRAGTSVCVAGDVNADGKADFLVGAPMDDPSGTDSGAGFLIYGGFTADSEIIFADGFEQ